MLYLICIMTLALSAYYMWTICRVRVGPVRWIYFEIIYNCFIKFLIGNLGLPSALNYVSDLILIIIVFYYFYYKKSGMKITIPSSLKWVIGIYFVITLLSYFVNLYSPLLYIWGFRNNMRFLIFAMMCAVFLKRRDIYTFLDILFGYFILNIFVVTYQFFFKGYNYNAIGDFISGLYAAGEKRGGNSALNWLLCIICAAAIIQYFNKEKSIWYLIVAIAGSTYMATLSELKVFFIEIIVISVVCICVSKKSLRLTIFLMLSVVALYAGIQVIYILFPNFNRFFTLETILAYATNESGYIGDGSINRLTAIRYVFRNFLTSISERLIGIGFGNSEYSSYSFFTSQFYLRNSWTAYQWFYGPIILIETGILGLFSFILIIVNYLYRNVKLKIENIKDNSLRSISLIVGILSLAMLFYNQSMKLETAGYMVQLFLCFPYILEKKEDFCSCQKSIVKTKVRFILK